MKVLVLGSGAREHALVRALSNDPQVTAVLAAPGNPGIASLADCLPVALDDPAAVAGLAGAHAVDLVVVGPEAPLVAGVADACRAAGIATFGPSAAAARLEGSKAFAKEIMAAAEVPTAMAHVATTPEQVEAALDAFGPPYVVKDDGLAAGKGVVVTDDRAAAVDHALACLAKPHGSRAEGPAGLPGPNKPAGLGAEGPAGLPGPDETAGLGAEGPAGLPGPNKTAGLGAEGPAGLPGPKKTAGLGAEGPAGLPGPQENRDSQGAVVIEEYLDGPEVSLFCVTDGTEVVPLEPAQDFKRLLDGDAGPNTGGMGAYSPLPWAPPDLTEQVLNRIAKPVVSELARRGTPFAGLLYCGLALTSRGIRVVEFNVRFGDPETQVVLARLATPLGGLLAAAATGELAGAAALRWRPEAAVTVVLAAHNYPGSPRTGDPIDGLAAGEETDDVHVLHAGTKIVDGRVVTAGGRVLSVVGLGIDLPAARKAAYAGVDAIAFDGSQHRTDIAAGR